MSTNTPVPSNGFPQDGSLENDYISRLARLRRDRVAAERALPDYLFEVRRTEVRYVFPVRLLPFAQASFAKLNTRLLETLHLRFKRPTSDDPGLTALFRDLSDDQLGQMLVGGEHPHLEWRNGVFPYRSADFVLIHNVSIGWEHVFAGVAGPGEVAEAVCAEVFESLRYAADLPKAWEEIKSQALSITHGSSTLVDIGAPPTKLLSDVYRRFLDEKIIGGPRLASYMDGLTNVSGFKPSSKMKTIYSVDELHIKLHHFDEQTGKSGESLLTIGIPARSYHGTSRVLVSTQLPFDKHMECVEMLRQLLSESKNKDPLVQ